MLPEDHSSNLDDANIIFSQFCFVGKRRITMFRRVGGQLVKEHIVGQCVRERKNIKIWLESRGKDKKMGRVQSYPFSGTSAQNSAVPEYKTLPEI